MYHLQTISLVYNRVVYIFYSISLDGIDLPTREFKSFWLAMLKHVSNVVSCRLMLKNKRTYSLDVNDDTKFVAI